MTRLLKKNQTPILTPKQANPSNGLVVICGILSLFSSVNATAAENPPLKTSQQVYQNPFDLAAGGASLTKATQEGVQFANPSLSALGPGFFRWIFLRQTMILGSEAILLAKNIALKKTDVSSSSLVEKALKTPAHVGFDLNAGMVTSHWGLSGFSATRVDLEGRQFGEMGLPELRLRMASYSGIAASQSKMIGKYLAFGSTTKYIYAGEINEKLSLLELSQAGIGADDIKKKVKYGQGMGLDIGTTFQLQGDFVDFRLAVVSTDFGGTKFTKNIAPWRQTFHSGVGVAFHSGSNVAHCSADLRDLTRAYGEHWTKRTYLGCKALFFKRIGFAAGLGQGWTSYGGVFNLSIMRLEAGSYAREVSSQAGTQGRRVFFLATAFEI